MKINIYIYIYIHVNTLHTHVHACINKSRKTHLICRFFSVSEDDISFFFL